MSKKDVTVTHGTDTVAPSIQAPAQTHDNAPPIVPERAINTSPYQSTLKGAPVQPGQDWRHLTPEQRRQWFSNLEYRWKQQYNTRQQGGQPVSMGWTRG